MAKDTKPDLEQVLARFDALLRHVEALLPPAPPPTNWKATAFRWRKSGGLAARGWLDPVHHVHKIRLADLQGIGAQIRKVEQNTRQALALSRRGYVLENGRVVLEGSGVELLGIEHVKRAYLGM